MPFSSSLWAPRFWNGFWLFQQMGVYDPTGVLSMAWFSGGETY